MSKFKAYRKISDCIESSSSFEELETSYNMVVLFKQKHNENVIYNRLLNKYESAVLRLCGN